MVLGRSGLCAFYSGHLPTSDFTGDMVPRSGLIIGYVTEYYTSHSYTPVREIANTQKQSAATGIIYGLALGYLSCIVPVICLGITILFAHSLCGMCGPEKGETGSTVGRADNPQLLDVVVDVLTVLEGT